MQTETTVRYRLTSVRVAVTKRNTNKCWQVWTQSNRLKQVLLPTLLQARAQNFYICLCPCSSYYLTLGLKIKAQTTLSPTTGGSYGYILKRTVDETTQKPV